MNANLAVIADNLDYLLWGRLAEGQPGGAQIPGRLPAFSLIL